MSDDDGSPSPESFWLWRYGAAVLCVLAAAAVRLALDPLVGTYHWLDLTPLGRQRHVVEFPHHDTYAKDS